MTTPDPALQIARSVVRRYLLARPHRSYEYDDLLSDACLGVAKAYQDWTPDKGMSRKNYAFLRSRYELLDGCARRGSAPVFVDLDEAPELPDVRDPYLAVEARLTVVALLRGLPAKHRSVTAEHYLLERTQHEVADSHGFARDSGNVSYILSKARRAMREAA